MTAKLRTRREIETEVARLTVECRKARRAYAISALVAKIDALNWVLGKADPFGSAP